MKIVAVSLPSLLVFPASIYAWLSSGTTLKTMSRLNDVLLSTATRPSHLPITTCSFPPPRSTTALSMGFLDNLLPDFLKSRDGDFVKLEESADTVFGPGPLLILYNCPASIDNDEIQDMLADEAPQAFRKGVTLTRINDNDNNADTGILDEPMETALERLIAPQAKEPSASTKVSSSSSPTVSLSPPSDTPVLLFSAFANAEMMSLYNLLGGEIYQETGGASSPACAKVVPNALQKPLGQVLEEICGDHRDAIQQTTESK